MDLHTFVQSILHGLLITFFNVAVFIAIWKHAVVIGMIHFMQYHSSHTPQMSHPFVIRCIVHHFHTEVLVTRLAILDQPIFIRMIKAALTLDGQRHWTPFHGLVDPYLAMLLQILTGTMWWKTLGGIFNVNRQQLFQLGITVGLSWLDAGTANPRSPFHHMPCGGVRQHPIKGPPTNLETPTTGTEPQGGEEEEDPSSSLSSTVILRLRKLLFLKPSKQGHNMAPQ
jgi:hypothetical protein